MGTFPQRLANAWTNFHMAVEDCAVVYAQPYGIYCVANKWRFSPRVRAAAFLFTAVTQTIRERDKQIQNRRVLAELACNRESRLDAWRAIGEWPFYMFGPPSSAQQEADWAKGPKNIAAIVEKWDKDFGQSEIQHRLNNLYSSRAILFKSVVAGVSLGTFPIIQSLLYYYGNRVFDWVVYGRPWKVDATGCIYMFCATTDPILHYMFTHLFDLPPPFLNCQIGNLGLAIGLGHALIACERRIKIQFMGYKSLQEWRSSPRCWYSRQGKLPLWQYNVENDSIVLPKIKSYCDENPLL